MIRYKELCCAEHGRSFDNDGIYICPFITRRFFLPLRVAGEPSGCYMRRPTLSAGSVVELVDDADGRRQNTWMLLNGFSNRPGG